MAQSLHIGFYGPFTNLPFWGCAMYSDNKVSEFEIFTPQNLTKQAIVNQQCFEKLVQISTPCKTVHFTRTRGEQKLLSKLAENSTIFYHPFDLCCPSEDAQIFLLLIWNVEVLMIYHLGVASSR